MLWRALQVIGLLDIHLQAIQGLNDEKVSEEIAHVYFLPIISFNHFFYHLSSFLPNYILFGAILAQMMRYLLCFSSIVLTAKSVSKERNQTPGGVHTI